MTAPPASYRMYARDESGRVEVLSIDGAQFFPDREPVVAVTLYIGHGVIEEATVPAERLYTELIETGTEPNAYQAAADRTAAVLAEMRAVAA